MRQKIIYRLYIERRSPDSPIPRCHNNCQSKYTNFSIPDIHTHCALMIYNNFIGIFVGFLINTFKATARISIINFEKRRETKKESESLRQQSYICVRTIYSQLSLSRINSCSADANNKNGFGFPYHSAHNERPHKQPKQRKNEKRKTRITVEEEEEAATR